MGCSVALCWGWLARVSGQNKTPWAGADGELAADLAAELRPAVVAEYERALHAIFTAGAERRRRAREAAGAALDEAHQRWAHGLVMFVIWLNIQ